MRVTTELVTIHYLVGYPSCDHCKEEYRVRRSPNVEYYYREEVIKGTSLLEGVGL